MATMALIGLPAESSSAQDHGMAGAVRGVGVAGVGAVDGAGAAVGVTDMAMAGADVDSSVDEATRMGRLADSMEQQEVSMALADFMAEVDSTVAEGSTAEVVVASTVAVAMAVVDTDNSGIAVLDSWAEEKRLAARCCWPFLFLQWLDFLLECRVSWGATVVE